MKMTMRGWRWTLPAVAALAWTAHGAGILPAGYASAQQPLNAVELAQPIAAEPLPSAAEEDAPGQAGPAAEADEGATADAPGAADDSMPAEGEEGAATENGGAVVELIKERYPGGAVKVEREMTQDSEGNYVLQGAWRQFDEQGRLIVDGRYDRNQKVGVWRKFYRGSDAPLLGTPPYKDFTGPFISQAHFHNGQIHGKWLMTDAKQRKVHDIEFCDGQRHGKATWYYPNGALMLQAQYEHGRVNGDVMKFAPDTSLIAQENYQAGRKLAPKTEYYDGERTVKKLETTFLHGPLAVKTPDNWDACTLATFETRGTDERHGPFTAWHKNGLPAKQGEFRYNLPVGKITQWYDNGQKQMEGLYVDGRQEGVWTWWHANGQKAITGEYHDATAIGKWSWWAADGKVAQRADMSSRPRSAPSPTPEADTEPREAKVRQLDLQEPAGLPR
jgi:antitoxin component YwqK of YwqJK toxin-antitoxin module